MEIIGKLLGNNKVELDRTANGFAYINPIAFEKKEGICYIPEFGADDNDVIISSYTYDDFYSLANQFIIDNNIPNTTPEQVTKELFETVDWQHVETLINDWVVHGIYEA